MKLLAEHRRSLGVTQAQAAERIGVKDFTTLSHWENGKRLAYHIAFLRMMKLYGLTVEDVLAEAKGSYEAD